MSADDLYKISRKQFLSGAAAGAAGLAAAGALTGCGGSAAPQEPKPEPSGEPSAPQGWEWETPPPAIPQSDIKETVATDVVVLGAGVAGMVRRYRPQSRERVRRSWRKVPPT